MKEKKYKDALMETIGIFKSEELKIPTSKIKVKCRSPRIGTRRKKYELNI